MRAADLFRWSAPGSFSRHAFDVCGVKGLRPASGDEVRYATCGSCIDNLQAALADLQRNDTEVARCPFDGQWGVIGQGCPVCGRLVVAPAAPVKVT